MCTALTYQTRDSYFGRNLDLEYSYRETVTVTPRNYPLPFRKMPALDRHYALIGMAYVQDNYPLYYDAVNEKGLAMAGLNFPGNAVYFPEDPQKENIAPFELIPWLLGQCDTVAGARHLLEKLCLVDICFAPQLPLSPLHWILADTQESIVLESTASGLHIYDSATGVLTNNPPYHFMEQYLPLFRSLSPQEDPSRFGPGPDMTPYCVGLNAAGLPGDFSSPSRFVKTAFLKANSLCDGSEEQSVGQFFRILDAVSMPRGCVRLGEGKNDITVYSACCNQQKGIYYYTTYDNRQISAVHLHRLDLAGQNLTSYPLVTGQQIHHHN